MILEPGMTLPVRYLEVFKREDVRGQRVMTMTNEVSLDTNKTRGPSRRSNHPPVCRQLYMPRQLTHGHSVRGFLQLDDLLIDKGRLFVNDDVGVHRAVLLLSLVDGGIAPPGQGEAREAGLDGEELRVPAGLAGDVEFRGTGGEDGG